MKKVVLILGLTVVGILVLVAAIGLMSSPRYAVAKSITIQAPPETVHQWVGDLKHWPEWLPWYDQDPSIATTYGETTTGVGAHQSWTGKSGDGDLTFTRCDPATGIAYDMAFIQGDLRMTSKVEMDYEKVEGGTKVTWSMEGSFEGIYPPVLKGLMGRMMGALIPKDFETGLEKLRTAVEKGAGPAAKDTAGESK